MEHCPNQKTIDQIEKLVVKGNGEPSLVTHIARMSSKLDDYMERQEALIKEAGITNREFYTFKTTIETAEKERDKQQVKTRWGIGIMTTILVACFTVISATLREKQKILEKRQDWTSIDVMYMQDSIAHRVRGINTLDLIDSLRNIN